MIWLYLAAYIVISGLFAPYVCRMTKHIRGEYKYTYYPLVLFVSMLWPFWICVFLFYGIKTLVELKKNKQ